MDGGERGMDGEEGMGSEEVDREGKGDGWGRRHGRRGKLRWVDMVGKVRLGNSEERKGKGIGRGERGLRGSYRGEKGEINKIFFK